MTKRETLKERMKQLSPAQRAKLLSKLKGEGQTKDYSIQPVQRDRDQWPVSHNQSRMWILQEFEGAGANNYNVSAAARIRGALDYELLQSSFDRVCTRHESLRTRFGQTNDGIVQLVSPQEKFEIARIDLGHLGAETAFEQGMGIIKKFAMSPFELTRYGQTNLHLVSLSDTDHILLLNQHHIIADGWSLGLIMKEWSFFYNLGNAVNIDDTQYDLHGVAKHPTQFIDYSQWQNGALSAGVFDQQYEYWRKQLSDAPAVCAMPSDYPNRDEPLRQGGFHSHIIDTELVAKLRGFSTSRNTSLFTVLQGCFHALLYRFGAGSDVVTGMAVANRNHHPSLESVVGFLANSLPIRSVINPDMTLSDLLDASHHTTMAAQDNQDVPLDLIVEKLNAPRLPGRTPIFQSMIVLQNAPIRGDGFGGADIEQIRLDTESAKFDLVVQFMPKPEGMALEITYDRNMYHRERIESFSAAFVHLLSSLEDAVHLPIDDLKLCSETTDTACEPLDIVPPVTFTTINTDLGSIVCSDRNGAPLPDYALGVCTSSDQPSFPGFRLTAGRIKPVNRRKDGWIGETWINLDWLNAQLTAHPNVRSAKALPIWRGNDGDPKSDIAVFIVPTKPLSETNLSDIWQSCTSGLSDPAHLALVSSDVDGRSWARVASVGTGEKTDLIKAMAGNCEAEENLSVSLQPNAPSRTGYTKLQSCRPLMIAPAPDANPDKPSSADTLTSPTSGFSPPANEKTDTQKLAMNIGPSLVEDATLPKTISDAITFAKERYPDHGITFVSQSREPIFQTYNQIYDEAVIALSGLQRHGLKKGDKLLLCHGNDRDLVSAIWACFLGGIVPVVNAVPPDFTHDYAVLTRLETVAQNLPDSPLLLAAADAKAYASRKTQISNKILIFEDITDVSQGFDQPCLPEILPQDDTLVLLTSGSTGAPKMVLHKNTTLLHQFQAIANVCGHSCEGISLNWLPLDHVGGLVMWHLRAIFDGSTQVQVQTNYVLEHPLNWMQLCSDYAVTTTWAPNFAFGLSARALERLEQEQKAHRLDLSALEVVLNAGEAVAAHVVQRFLAAAEPFGLDPMSMTPAWGMSETSSAVAVSRGYKKCPQSNAVCLGEPIADVKIRIMNADGQINQEGELGTLEVSGPTILHEYFDNAKANAESFSSDGWFKTGDLAFLKDGQLFFAGRDKDVIVINGVNYQQSDIEAAIENVPGIAPSYTAACGVVDPSKDTEAMAIFFHPIHPDDKGLRQTLADVGEAVFAASGLRPDVLVPVQKEKIPKTSIGKIQRPKLVKDYLSGAFHDEVEHAKRLRKPPELLDDYHWSVCWTDVPANTDTCFDGAYRSVQYNRIAFIGADKATARQFGDIGLTHLGPLDDPEAVQGGLAQNTGGLDAALLWLDGQSTDPSTLFMQISQLARQLNDFHLAQSHDVKTRLPFLCVVDASSALSQTAKGILPGLFASLGGDFPNIAPTLLELPKDTPNLAESQGWLTWLPQLWGREGRYRLRLKPKADKTFTLQKHALRRTSVRPEKLSDTPVFDRDKLHVIIGGLGGIGQIVAETLLRAGGHVCLMGRTKPSDASPMSTLTNLAAHHNGSCDFACADISDANALHEVLRTLNDQRPITALWHMAGTGNLREHWQTVDTRRADRMSRPDVDSYFQAKGTGTEALVQSLEFLDHAHLIGFSSVNAIFGGASFAAYSAANSLMTEILLSAPQKRTKILHWSQWLNTGMSQDNDTQMIDLAENSGFKCLKPQDALNSLKFALSSEDREISVGLDPNSLNISWRIEGDTFPLWKMAAKCDTTIKMPDVAHNRLGAPFEIFRDGPDHDQPSALSAEHSDRARALEDKVQTIWSGALNLPVSGAEDNFFDVGGSSVLIVQLHRLLQDLAGTSFPITELFSRPTVRTQASLLVALTGETPAQSATERPDGNSQKATDQSPGNRGELRRKRVMNRRKKP